MGFSPEVFGDCEDFEDCGAKARAPRGRNYIHANIHFDITANVFPNCKKCASLFPLLPSILSPHGRA